MPELLAILLDLGLVAAMTAHAPRVTEQTAADRVFHPP